MAAVPGLTYKPDVLDAKEESELVEFFNSNDWEDTPFHRKVQQFGHQYDYKTRGLAGEYKYIPKILYDLAKKLNLPEPKNIIVNRYLPGEGISPHVDSNVFGDTIASLTLNSGIQMDFKKGSNEQSLYLQPRSLILMQGEARNHWTHGIVTRKSDYVAGKKVLRGTRISITFRTLA